MAQRNPPRLRTLLTLIAGVVVLLVLLASVALLILATVLHQTSDSLGDAVESVRLAEEAEIDLLAHTREDDPDERRALEQSIHGKLAQTRTFTATATEAAVQREAERRVDEYLTIARREPHGGPRASAALDRAYALLEELVNVKTAQSRASRARAEQWDTFGTILGIGTSVALLGLTACLVFWLWTRAFQPVSAQSATINRFATGDRNARAEETGPGELRDMARHFNDLADAIAAQRDAQMAFLAGVAHDLRNPLSAIKLSVTAIPPDAPLPPESRIRRTMTMLDRQLTRIERMLGDLIDTAKAESGQLELRFEPCDARALVRHVVELFESVSPGHVIETRLPDRPVMIECDPLRIEQVIGNLVSNAIKYSPDGSPIFVSLSAEGGDAAIAVTDHGIGISRAERERLFEPFRRGRAAQDGPPGVGLGLFVGRRIIDGHGGRIEVDSEPGRGSTFRVHLALLDPLRPRTLDREWRTEATRH